MITATGNDLAQYLLDKLGRILGHGRRHLYRAGRNLGHLDPLHKLKQGRWYEAYGQGSDRWITLTPVATGGSILKLYDKNSHNGEYFLVENRYRDVGADGLVLRVWKDGQILEERFANGAEDFNSRTIEGFGGGVVVGADDYDWALPGGLDEEDNPLLGGALIWHIDESGHNDNEQQ
mgnify:CR=1 FL=1